LSSSAEGGGFAVEVEVEVVVADFIAGAVVTVVVAVAVASRYAKPSGLALSSVSTKEGFSPWGMPSYPVPNSKAS
jgi:stage V sporulation protein SpoVS